MLMFMSAQARDVEAFFDAYAVEIFETNLFKKPNRTVLLCVSVRVRGKAVPTHFTVAP